MTFWIGLTQYAIIDHVAYAVEMAKKEAVVVPKPYRRTLSAAAREVRAAKNLRTIAHREARGAWSADHKPGEPVPFSNNGRRALSPRTGKRRSK